MNTTKPTKFTFKNEPREVGLRSVGAGTPAINIKYAGVEVGLICFNDHWNANKNLGIQIRLMIPKDVTPESRCLWEWQTLTKFKFGSADEAKLFLNTNFEKIASMIYVNKEEG